MKNQDPFANPNIAKTIRDRYHDRNHNNDYAKNNLGFGLFHYAFIRNIRPANVLVVGSQRGYVPSICGVACRDEGAGTVDFVDAGSSIDETTAWGGGGSWGGGGWGLGEGLDGWGEGMGGGRDLGFAVGATANTDLGAVFFVLELGEAIFAHQIDDRLDLFNIHIRTTLPLTNGRNQKENTLSLK